MEKIPTPLDIEFLALKAGKKMGQVCQEAGVAHNTYCRWKHGKTAINVSTLQKLLDALQASADT